MEETGTGTREGRQTVPETDWRAGLKGWTGLLVKAAIVALIAYQVVFQISVVRLGSMKPAFEEWDKVLVDRLTYRLRDPRPGDVVIFEGFDAKRWKSAPQDFIKRVIARPGEVVKVRENAVYVNGRRLAEPWLAEEFAEPGDWVKGEDYLVPPHCYFVLGDNRSQSRDSRRHAESLGFVHERQIKGVVRLRLWPLGRLAWF